MNSIGLLGCQAAPAGAAISAAAAHSIVSFIVGRMGLLLALLFAGSSVKRRAVADLAWAALRRPRRPARLRRSLDPRNRARARLRGCARRSAARRCAPC